MHISTVMLLNYLPIYFFQGDMKTQSYNCNEDENQSSCNNKLQTKVPTKNDSFQEFKPEKPIAPFGDHDKVPISQNVLSNDNCEFNSNNNDASVEKSDTNTMSPVEGPINDIPKTIFDKNPDKLGDTTGSSEGCEEFSGQIVYNPDGSAYIIEENDETLLDQIPKQEGSIVERAGKCQSEVEYPKIDQAVYIARRKAWYNAMGSAYLQFLQGKSSECQSPNVHNFRVVSVKDKLKCGPLAADSHSQAEDLTEGTRTRQ